MNNFCYAGFWVRLGASLIDLIFILVIVWIPLTLIYGADYWMGTQVVHGVWDILLSYVLPIVATVWFWRKYLGTPGKMALKLRVVDAKTGNPLTVPQAIGRYFAYLVSILPLFLGFVWIAVDNKKQGWHDKLSGSVVIRDKAETPVEFSN